MKGHLGGFTDIVVPTSKNSSNFNAVERLNVKTNSQLRERPLLVNENTTTSTRRKKVQECECTELIYGIGKLLKQPSVCQTFFRHAMRTALPMRPDVVFGFV